MKTIGQRLLPHRFILALLTGVFTSTLLIAWMENVILASILGTLITLLVAQPEQLKDFLSLGSATGILIGPYVGIRLYLNSNPVPVDTIWELMLPLLGGLILTGCLCALYGFLTGKFLMLYKKGQGPFF